MTKVVQFSDEAYRLLTNAKRRGESYSDVVTRLLRRGDLRRLARLRTPTQLDEAEALLREADALDEPGR